MMEHITPALVGLFSLISGGGLMWVMYPRLKRKEAENEIYIKKYAGIDRIIDDFIQTNADLARQVAALHAQVDKSESRTRQIIQFIDENCDCKNVETLKKLVYGK